MAFHPQRLWLVLLQLLLQLFLFGPIYFTSFKGLTDNEYREQSFENSKLKQRPYFSQEKFQLVYELQSLQRCFKACGSFASFMNMKQDKRYLKYLAPTLKKVMMSLLNFPEYNILQKILIDSAALEKNYESLP